MFLKKIELKKYKILEDISINFDHKDGHNIFPIISVNGGGKSTLLQLIFSFLHFSFKRSRYKYLKEILGNFLPIEDNENLETLIDFELDFKNKLIEISFLRCKNGYKNISFNSILDLREVHDKRKDIKDKVSTISKLNMMVEDINSSRISNGMVVSEIRKIIREQGIEDEYNSTVLRRFNPNAGESLQIIEKIKSDLQRDLMSDDELDEMEIKAQAGVVRLNKFLDEKGLRYAFHYNKNEEILLYSTNVEDNILEDMSNHVSLAIPNTQVLHFFSDEKLEMLFRNENYLYSSYEHYIRECKKDDIKLFSYEFAAIGLIVEAFKKARDDDFKEALNNNGKYGNQINDTIKEVNNLLIGKSITVDSNFTGVTFKTTKANNLLTPKDLSHGELKKLSVYIWLKAITSDNSLVLMDEVEVGLHPTWQQDLYNDLQTWGKGDQFIIATHSPQIISRTYYKNLVVLERMSNDKTTARQFNHPPLENDLNTIVKTIMGGEYIPEELVQLQAKYRELFNENKLDTDEAKAIKEEILIYETEDSSFFQDIKFLNDLK